MTAVLAAAARVVLEAVLVLAAVSSVFWAAVGPQDGRTVVFLAVMFVTITGAVLGVSALQPKGDHDGAYPEDWQEQGWCCRECAVMAWSGMSLDARRHG